MRFQVPQFIEIEDKVFGPFTFKQFVYIAGGTGICFLLLYTLPRFLAIIAVIPVAALSLALAFYRINNKPFVQMVEAFFRYIIGTRLYLWHRTDKQVTGKAPLARQYEQIKIPTLEGSKLKDIQWSLGVKKDGVSE